jgi:hypothetical protein
MDPTTAAAVDPEQLQMALTGLLSLIGCGGAGGGMWAIQRVLRCAEESVNLLREIRDAMKDQEVRLAQVQGEVKHVSVRQEGMSERLAALDARVGHRIAG